MPPITPERPDHFFEAMVEVILNQCLLGLGDSLLDGMELLGDVEARPPALDHLDDAAKMTIGALQPLDDLRVGLVSLGWLGHRHILSPCRGYTKMVERRKQVARLAIAAGEVRYCLLALLRFCGCRFLRGKAFPLADTALPTHPLQRGDPATPPESSSADVVSATG